MNEKHELIIEWINKADHDLGSAKLIFLHIPQYFDTIAFHCQQAVEKYLKAALIHFDIEAPKTHNLLYLLDILSNHLDIDDATYDKAIILNGYSVQIRYPDKSIYLATEELKSSIEIAQEFRTLILHTLGINDSDLDNL
jgi:HEPN domain-containing protein